MTCKGIVNKCPHCGEEFEESDNLMITFLVASGVGVVVAAAINLAVLVLL